MEGMAIQDVQFATGLSSHTLRYYEKAGLMINPIPPPPTATRRAPGPSADSPA